MARSRETGQHSRKRDPCRRRPESWCLWGPVKQPASGSRVSEKEDGGNSWRGGQVSPGFAGHSDFIPSQQRAPDGDESNLIWLEFVLNLSGRSVENGSLCSFHSEHLVSANSWASVHLGVFP